MARKKLPDSVKMSGVHVKIAYRTNLQEASGVKLDGSLNIGERLMYIEAELPWQSQVHTIWHELLHGFAHLTGQRLTNERTIDALAYFIMDTLARNPELARLSAEGGK